MNILILKYPEEFLRTEEECPRGSGTDMGLRVGEFWDRHWRCYYCRRKGAWAEIGNDNIGEGVRVGV